MDNAPKTLLEIKKLRKPLRNVNIEHKENLNRLDKLALWITDHVGTMGFFMVIFGWTAIWLGWNCLAPENLRFDPVPTFGIWLFMSNLIQIFLMPLIMISQNIQSKHSEARAEADFEINVKAELEIETVLHNLEIQNEHLKKQNDLILQILVHTQQGKEGAVKKDLPNDAIQEK